MNEQLKGREIVERDEIAQGRVEYVGSAGKETQGLLEEEGDLEQIADVAEDQVEEIDANIQMASPGIETFSAVDSVIEHGTLERERTMSVFQSFGRGLNVGRNITLGISPSVRKEMRI